MSTSAPARPASSADAHSAGASPARAGRDRDARGLGAVRASMPRVAWYVACGCVALLFLYPLGIMLGTALTAQDGSVGLGNLQRLLTPTGGLDLVTSLRNSVVVSLLVTALTVVVSTLAGYAFARLPFRGSDLVFFLVLITFMIPFQAIITPLFLTLIEPRPRQQPRGPLARARDLQPAVRHLPHAELVRRGAGEPGGGRAHRREHAAAGDAPGDAAHRDPRRRLDRAPHLLLGVERLLRDAHPHHRPEPVHAAGEPQHPVGRPEQHGRLGSDADGRRRDGDPLRRALPAAAAVLRGRPHQRRGEVGPTPDPRARLGRRAATRTAHGHEGSAWRRP
ncbi:hypothetical protein WDV94_13460 [Clavibacter tessellarius]